MDIARPKSVKRKRYLKYAFFGVLLAGGVVAATVALSKLERAVPSVDRSTVLIDTVKRGEMLRNVRGLGTLVPEVIQFVPAPTEGRVVRVNVKPGDHVTAGSVLVDLVNPQIEQEAIDADYKVKAAEADLANLRVQLDSARMTQQATTAGVQAEYNQAKLQSDTDETLAKEGLVPELNLKLSRVRLSELSNRLSIEQQRLAINSQAIKAQIDAQQARIEQLKALAALKRGQVVALHVVASAPGVVQEVMVQVGQQLTLGSNIARVADPTSLKAQLKIPETQIKDVAIGQIAQIDTRNGIIPGRVIRIEPASREGTVAVDVQLEGELPSGARPDLNVDGTIEIERLTNVLYVGRPMFGQGQSSVGFFKLEADGRTAVRVTVKLGRTSVSTVEITEGAKEGDQLILSDTSQWDSHPKIRLQ